MNLEHYSIETGTKALTYEFTSEGPKGKILKIVQFSSLVADKVFNLGFGDKNLKTSDLDDKIVTDNGDTEKILATVVIALYAFCEKFPYALIYATGSTPARTRLYRMGINKYFDVVNQDFEIYGRHTEWETYQKGKDYNAFAVSRKTLKFEI